MMMARSAGGSLLALSVAALIAGCSGSTDPAGGGGGGGGVGGGGGSGTVVVNMQNTAFVGPVGTDDITINLGDTVRWVNLDGVSHTATSTNVPAGGNSFASGTLGTNDTFDFVPNTVGTWTYMCEVHPGTMFGATITVVSSGAPQYRVEPTRKEPLTEAGWTQTAEYQAELQPSPERPLIEAEWSIN